LHFLDELQACDVVSTAQATLAGTSDAWHGLL